MKNNISRPPIPQCEPVKSYATDTPERKEVQKMYKQAMTNFIEIPMWINGKNVKSKIQKKIFPPHNHKHAVG